MKATLPRVRPMSLLCLAMTAALALGTGSISGCAQGNESADESTGEEQGGDLIDESQNRETDPYGGTTGELGSDGEQEIRLAKANLNPTEGNAVDGTVTFQQTANGVRVTAEITGLTPGEHGFHVHEVGDCSAPDASSAMGHFNPENVPHGGPDNPPNERHVGDLGNIHASEDGTATMDRVDPLLSLSGAHSIIGRAVIVHSGKDTYEAQPSGDAGSRVACAVIEVADSSQAENY